MSDSVFVSYAQNREDVILWRALSNISCGFYIDVGANHPTDDSVTKAFYDRGWSGINIEPLPSHLHQLQSQRKRDINLGVAAGSYEGCIELYDTPIRGLATASPNIAKKHKENGLDISAINVPVRRLDKIWDQYVDKTVHFLKIDVEGFEKDVLLGMNLVTQRPWIIVIEATRPNSQEIDANWESLILDHEYQLVYFDGLNRYYLANEHLNLSFCFSSPPNVFDNYISAEEYRLSKEINQKVAELKISRNIIDSFSAKENNKKQLNFALQKQIEGIYRSYSWKITAPLRSANEFSKKIKKKIFLKNNTQKPEEKSTENITVRCHHNALKSITKISKFKKKSESSTIKKSWRMVGHVEGHYSLAAVNRGLSIALDLESDKHLNFVACHGKPYIAGDDIPQSQLEAIKEIIARPTLTDANNIDTISLVHHYPLITDPKPAKLRLFVFFWEESRVPEAMVTHLNNHSDVVLVSSDFVHNALRYSGYRNLIFKIPLGLPEYILKSPKKEISKKFSNLKKFRFLHISSGFERKGIDVLLKAYFKSFNKNDNVELFIKSFPNPHHNLPSIVNNFQDLYPDAAKVILDLDDYSESDMLNIYLESDAFVLPSRGEGFGLPAAEAMALGLPVITTGFGGQTEFATHQTAFLVPYSIKASNSHLRSDGSYWAEPCAEDLAQQMTLVRNLVLSNNSKFSKKCKAASDWCRKNYRWEESATAINNITEDILEKNINKININKKFIVISPWNTPCGIAEYSQALLENWDKVFDIEIFCDTRTVEDKSQKIYNPSWKVGNDIDVLNILKNILNKKEKFPEFLLIQHQPSLFTLNDEICYTLMQIEKAGTTVILELHSTLPLTRERRLNAKAASSLSLLSLIVVHKIEDIQHCLWLGLVNNVMLLPLGISELDENNKIITRKDFQLEENDLVLGCFGFLWPHKGIDSVIRSLKPISKRTGRRVKLLAVTATSDEKSLKLLDEYKKLSKSLTADENIIWVTEFLPIQKSLRILALADFQIFAYGKSSESASAAVTIGLATKKPVLVSPEPIFSDLSEFTYKLSGNKSNDIEEAIIHLIQNSNYLKSLNERQNNWLSERSWSTVSSRMMNTISGIANQRKFQQPIFENIQILNVPKQLLVDVSEIVLRDAGTGIQRVVHSILQNWINYTPDGYVIRPVCALKEGSYVYTSKFSLFGDNLAQQLHDQLVEVSPGDIFVGLDLSAHLFPEAEKQLHSWRIQGVLICYVIYDIIPLLHPEKVVAGIIPAFENWMNSLAKEADRLICISEAVANDVINWLSHQHGNLGLPEVSYFSLGADIPNSKKNNFLDESEIIFDKSDSSISFLMVGTVEPRKGYAYALDAMDFLWNSGCDVHLVIVGKQGWMVEDLCERIKSHFQFGKRLHWFHNANDALLHQLYLKCSALLATSEAEGFGLPLVEAAQHGLPIIARDLPVFKEIAKEHAFYFHSDEKELLGMTLITWIDLYRQGFAPSSINMPWISWHESAQQLWKQIQ